MSKNINSLISSIQQKTDQHKTIELAELANFQANLKQAYSDELSRLTTDLNNLHQQQIDSLSLSHQSQITAIQNNHDQQIRQINDTHKQQTDKLLQTIKDQQTEITEFLNTSNSHRVKLGELIQDQNQQIVDFHSQTIESQQATQKPLMILISILLILGILQVVLSLFMIF